MQRSIFLGILLIPYCFLNSIQGEEAIIRSSNGERLKVTISEEQTVLQLKLQITEELGYLIEEQKLIYEGKFLKNCDELRDFYEKEFFLLIENELETEAIAKSAATRVYSEQVSAEDKKDIRFVVTTLANKSLLKLAKYRPQLEDAGERLEHVHPLRFFQCIFSDDELIVGIRNIRKRGWVWDEFRDNSIKRLQQECERSNLYQFVNDFAQNIGINSALILPALQNKQWDNFINILIKEVPRKGDADRYDQ